MVDKEHLIVAYHMDMSPEEIVVADYNNWTHETK